jgi:hypothetical protein
MGGCNPAIDADPGVQRNGLLAKFADLTRILGYCYATLVTG